MSGSRPSTSMADAAARLMQEREIARLMWGDGTLTDVYYAAGRPPVHPLRAMGAVLDAMERSPMFEKGHVHGCDSRGRERVVRCFTLKSFAE